MHSSILTQELYRISIASSIFGSTLNSLYPYSILQSFTISGNSGLIPNAQSHIDSELDGSKSIGV